MFKTYYNSGIIRVGELIMENILFYIIFSIILITTTYLLLKKKKTSKKASPPQNKSAINIVLENKQIKKNKSNNKQEIIHEAEALFKTLLKKHPYSPLPFKILGDFYRQKKLDEEATKKYKEMIPYLNNELNLEKLNIALNYLETIKQNEIALKIRNYFNGSD